MLRILHYVLKNAKTDTLCTLLHFYRKVCVTFCTFGKNALKTRHSPSLFAKRWRPVYDFHFPGVAVKKRPGNALENGVERHILRGVF